MLSGKREHQIGRIARAVAKTNVMRFGVCFGQLAQVKADASCAVLTLVKLIEPNARQLNSEQTGASEFIQLRQCVILSKLTRVVLLRGSYTRLSLRLILILMIIIVIIIIESSERELVRADIGLMAAPSLVRGGVCGFFARKSVAGSKIRGGRLIALKATLGSLFVCSIVSIG